MDPSFALVALALLGFVLVGAGAFTLGRRLGLSAERASASADVSRAAAERGRFEAISQRVPVLERELAATRVVLDQREARLGEAQVRIAELVTRLSESEKAAAEKLELMTRAEASMKNAFQARSIVVAAVVGVVLLASGCDKYTDSGQTVGQKLDKAIDKTNASIAKAGDKVEQKVDTGADGKPAGQVPSGGRPPRDDRSAKGGGYKGGRGAPGGGNDRRPGGRDGGRDPRRDDSSREGGRRDDRRRDGGDRGRFTAAPDKKRVEVDPNSPFAALSQLKAQLEKRADGETKS